MWVVSCLKCGLVDTLCGGMRMVAFNFYSWFELDFESFYTYFAAGVGTSSVSRSIMQFATLLHVGCGVDRWTDAIGQKFRCTVAMKTVRHERVRRRERC